MAPSVRGLPPQAGGGESLALYEVSDEDTFLSLSPLRGQLPHRGSLLCSGKLYIPAYSKGPPYCGRAFRAGVRNRKRRMALLKCALMGRKPICRGDHCPPLQGGDRMIPMICRGRCLHCRVAKRAMPQWGIEPHERASFAGWRALFCPPSGPAGGCKHPPLQGGGKRTAYSV